MNVLIRAACCLGLVLILCFSGCAPVGTGSNADDGVNVLLLASKNWGLNSFLTLDRFDYYGWDVTVAGVMDSITACPPVHEQLGMHPLLPDLKISETIDPAAYDCIVIPSGSGSYYPVPDAFGDLKGSTETLQLIRRAEVAGIPIYATCSGVRVLAAADVLRGRSVVGADKFQEEYEAAGAAYAGKNHPPAMDRRVITTARGLYYHVINAQAIATAVEDCGSMGRKRIPKRNPVVSSDIDFNNEDVVWSRTYGGGLSDGGEALCIAEDGGYLVTGYTFSLGHGDADVLVIKTDSRGEVEWSRILGGAGTEYGYDCIASDGGYLITGYTTSFGEGSKDVLLLKLGADGNRLWQKTYGGESWDVGTSLCQDSDGGIYICGFTHSEGAGEEDVYLIKTDNEGNMIWSRTYGGNRFELGHGVAMMEDGGLLLGATTGTYGGNNSDLYLIKTDGEGNEIWAKPYGTKGRRGYGFDCATAMAVAPDGGVLLAGYTDCRDIQDGHAKRIDADGNELWAATFGNIPFYDYGLAAVALPDGGFIVSGTTKFQVKTPQIYNNDFYYCRFDANGSALGEWFIGDSGKEWANDAVVTDEGDLMLLGYTTSGGAGKHDVCLLRIRGMK